MGGLPNHDRSNDTSIGDDDDDDDDDDRDENETSRYANGGAPYLQVNKQIHNIKENDKCHDQTCPLLICERY